MRAGARLGWPGGTALAAAALTLAPTGAPDAVAQDRCTARGAKTVAVSGDSRVFSVAIKRGRKYYGCLKGSRPVRLTTAFISPDPKVGSVTVTRFRLSGSFVAWFQEEESDFGVGEFAQGIVVRSLQRGGRKLDVDLPERYDGLAALAVRADGAVAWILSTTGRNAEVDKVDAKAKEPTALSYARNIDSSSLRVDDDSVDWREAGTSRSAPLR